MATAPVVPDKPRRIRRNVAGDDAALVVQTKKGRGGATSMIIEIPEMVHQTAYIVIQGFTPLISHNFGEKSKQQMREKQQQKARNKREAKDPQVEYEQSLYPIPGKKNAFGFPASAIKKAMVSSCRYVEGINMTFAKGAFHIEGRLLEIQKAKPKMREDVVRLNSGVKPVADLRYRAEFGEGWEMTVPVTFNPRAINPSSVVNLLKIAGHNIGIGEWRPEKNGDFGRFRVTKFNVPAA